MKIRRYQEQALQSERPMEIIRLRRRTDWLAAVLSNCKAYGEEFKAKCVIAPADPATVRGFSAPVMQHYWIHNESAEEILSAVCPRNSPRLLQLESTPPDETKGGCDG